MWGAPWILEPRHRPSSRGSDPIVEIAIDYMATFFRPLPSFAVFKCGEPLSWILIHPILEQLGDVGEPNPFRVGPVGDAAAPALGLVERSRVKALVHVQP